MKSTHHKGRGHRKAGLTAALALSLGALPLIATPASAATLVDIGPACDGAPESTLNDAETTPTPSGDSNWREVIDCLNAPNGYEGEDGAPVLAGNDAGNANFSALVTRAQFAGIFSRIIEAAGLATDENAPTPFTDIDGAFFEGAIRAMYAQGLTEGKTSTTYDTQSSLIMGQLATFCVRLIEKVTGETLATDGTSNVNANYGVHSTNGEKLYDNGFLTDGQAADGVQTVLRGDIFAMAARAISHFVSEGILENPFAPPAPTQFTIVRCAPGAIDFNDADSVERVTYNNTASSTDKFTVDGSTASVGVFEAACNIGDLIAYDTTARTFDLTNVDSTKRTSGTIGNIDQAGTDFDFIDPVSGVALRPNVDWSGGVYTIDGVSASQSAFAAALNEGDTLVVTGTSPNQTFALTNRAASGTVTVTGATAGTSVDFFVDPVAGDSADSTYPLLGDDPTVADVSDDEFRATNAGSLTVPPTEQYFVDGNQVPFSSADPNTVNFEDAISSGDTITVERNAGLETFRLTNSAPTPVQGVVRGDNTFSPGGANDGGAISIVTPAGTVAQAYSSTTKFIRNGVQVTEAEFEAANQVTPGDTAKYTAPDTATSTAEVLEVNDANLSGFVDNVVMTDDNTLNELFDIDNNQGHVIEAAYNPAAPANPRYLVNGALVTASDFAQYLESIAKEQALAGFTTSNDTVEVVNTVGGTDIKLTTDNAKA